jgi:hypothetical protein
LQLIPESSHPAPSANRQKVMERKKTFDCTQDHSGDFNNSTAKIIFTESYTDGFFKRKEIPSKSSSKSDKTSPELKQENEQASKRVKKCELAAALDIFCNNPSRLSSSSLEVQNNYHHGESTQSKSAQQKHWRDSECSTSIFSKRMAWKHGKEPSQDIGIDIKNAEQKKRNLFATADNKHNESLKLEHKSIMSRKSKEGGHYTSNHLVAQIDVELESITKGIQDIEVVSVDTERLLAENMIELVIRRNQ